MPPQQSQRLLDLLGDGLHFGAHAFDSGNDFQGRDLYRGAGSTLKPRGQ